ncbi:MAG: radical SAM protein [Pseudomonadota bacterium]
MKVLTTYNFEYLKNVLSFIRMFPSLHIGSKHYHSVFPRRASLILYITNRCNSRCIACNHWTQKPKYDLSIKAIEALNKAISWKNNSFLVEGGEAVLHPDFDKIMDVLHNRKINLLTNGLLTNRLVKIVEKYKISRVSISLDGGRKTYEKMRGVDGYDNVLETIDILRNKTTLGVSFTITPWNNYDDYLHVKEICEEKNILLQTGIFAAMDYMGAKTKESLIDLRYESLGNPYINTYNKWVNSQNKPPCFAMRFVAVVRSNGDVALCQHKDIILGNIYERHFDEIWNDEKTMKIQDENRFCNDCWVASHRSFDVKFDLLLKKIFPDYLYKKMINKI